jgi:hypothetical protein
LDIFKTESAKGDPLLNAKVAGEKNFDFLKSQMEGAGKP